MFYAINCNSARTEGRSGDQPVPYQHSHGRLLTTVETLLIVLLLQAALVPASAVACYDLTVRDAAFGVPRDVHRLCIMAQADDPAGQALHDRLAGWFETRGASLNVELVNVVADDPEVRWDEYGIPSAPPSLPVVVLAGSRHLEQRGFYIDHWEPGPTSDDFEAIRTSPARERIRAEVVRKLAVLLYVPGTDTDTGSAEPVLDAVVSRWSRTLPLGLSIVRVDRADERERVLLSFTGVRDQGPDWVAVAFGRGKIMPPLEGTNITEPRLDELITLVAGECTCLRPPATLGVDIPMMWDDEDDAGVVPLRTGVGSSQLAWSSPAEFTSPPVRQRTLAPAAWTLAALVLAIGLGTLATVLLRNRGRIAPARN